MQVQLDLNDNELEGRIPEEYGQLAQLHRLDLHNNLLEGAIPEPLLSERMGQLSHLDLSANRLVGSIPRGLCRMTHLASLNLASNAGLLAAQRRVATCAAPCVSVCICQRLHARAWRTHSKQTLTLPVEKLHPGPLSQSSV